MGSTSKTLTPLRERQHESAKPEAIRRQLHEILASPAFHGSKRCQQFLEYVCEKMLAGEDGSLKERSIAIEAFGRQPQTDWSEDTIVRVGAREVRKRLAQYYITPEGAAAEIRIDLPPGSYVPEFRNAVLRAEEKERHAAAAATEAIAAGTYVRWRTLAIVGGLALAAVLATIALSRPESPNTQAFARFWEPVFHSTEPLLVAVAHPIVYHASPRATQLSESNQPPQEIPRQRPIQVRPDQVDGSDFIPVLNQYVGFGDLVAATDVSAMLARKSKTVRVRMASGLEFTELRNVNALLIGAVTNRWTMELQQSWRFQFARNQDWKTVVMDTMDASAPKDRRQWSISQKLDGSAPEDYILVSRICNSLTGGMVLVGAGLKQFGTEAAGGLLCDPDRLGAILRKLPGGWETRNLQIVLHARVIGNSPAQPEVVAWHVW